RTEAADAGRRGLVCGSGVGGSHRRASVTTVRQRREPYARTGSIARNEVDSGCDTTTYSCVCCRASGVQIRHAATAILFLTVAPLLERLNEYCPSFPCLPAGGRHRRVPPPAAAGMGRADCRRSGRVRA